MEQLLIGEKNYISSKRAAQLTGYAKDYVGQLCREGRVPARLVGRSWYVLESAIRDHRFSATDPRSEKPARSAPLSPPTWESPRYEASSDELLPPLNRVQAADISTEPADVPPEVSQQHLQDSWRAWFERVGNSGGPDVSEPEEEAPPAPEPVPAEEAREVETEEVNIPIRTVYELPPDDLLPRRHVTEVQDDEEFMGEQQERRPARGRGMVRTIQMAGVLVAAVTAIFAALGTGYLDKYIISNSPVGIIAGVASYNR